MVTFWYRYRWVRGVLTALYLGWLRTYEGEQTPGRELAEAEWINTLLAFKPHLKLPACIGGHQEPPPPPPPDPGADEEWELYPTTSADTEVSSTNFTVTYTHDGDGNVKTRTDASGTTK